MLVSELMRQRGIGVTTGNPVDLQQTALRENSPPVNDAGQTFAQVLDKSLGQGGVEFSGHAIKRMSSRAIDITQNDKLERLNKGVELAAQKGSQETLILVDEAAFIVSVANNKVITTLERDEMMGNVFTNIDSTVII